MLSKRLLAKITASAVLLIPASVFAQGGVWQIPSAAERYRSTSDAQVSYYDARRTAYDAGYREGVKEGENDGRRGDRFDYQDEREFQRADRGYHRSFGDRERYRQIFRDGYIAGYRETFSRWSRYGSNDGRYNQGRYGNGPYNQRGPYGTQGGYGTGRYPGGGYYSPAYDNGLRDGYEKGLEDVRKRRSFDPRRHSWYRSGDRDYENRYGSRDLYKDAYRRAFQDGYERGFQEGRFRY